MFVSRRSSRPWLILIKCSAVGTGGVHVDHSFRSTLAEKLSAERQYTHAPDDVRRGMIFQGVKDFQQSAKRQFYSPEDTCEIELARRAMTNKEIPILKGVMSVDG